MVVIVTPSERRPWNFQRMIWVIVCMKWISLNFYIGDLRSGEFKVDLSIISHWEKIRRRLFWTNTILNIFKHRATGKLDTLKRKIATTEPSLCPRGHLRYLSVILDRHARWWKHKHAFKSIIRIDWHATANWYATDLFRSSRGADLR